MRATSQPRPTAVSAGGSGVGDGTLQRCHAEGLLSARPWPTGKDEKGEQAHSGRLESCAIAGACESIMARAGLIPCCHTNNPQQEEFVRNQWRGISRHAQILWYVLYQFNCIDRLGTSSTQRAPLAAHNSIPACGNRTLISHTLHLLGQPTAQLVWKCVSAKVRYSYCSIPGILGEEDTTTLAHSASRTVATPTWAGTFPETLRRCALLASTRVSSQRGKEPCLPHRQRKQPHWKMEARICGPCFSERTNGDSKLARCKLHFHSQDDDDVSSRSNSMTWMWRDTLYIEWVTHKDHCPPSSSGCLLSNHTCDPSHQRQAPGDCPR